MIGKGVDKVILGRHAPVLAAKRLREHDPPQPDAAVQTRQRFRAAGEDNLLERLAARKQVLRQRPQPGGQDEPAQPAAIAEGALPNLLHAVRYDQPLEPSASGTGVLADSLEGGRQGQAGQAFAIRKSAVRDFPDAVRNHQLFERPASRECGHANPIKEGRQGQRGQIFTIGKSSAPDFPDASRDVQLHKRAASRKGTAANPFEGRRQGQSTQAFTTPKGALLDHPQGGREGDPRQAAAACKRGRVEDLHPFGNHGLLDVTAAQAVRKDAPLIPRAAGEAGRVRRLEHLLPAVRQEAPAVPPDPRKGRVRETLFAGHNHAPFSGRRGLL